VGDSEDGAFWTAFLRSLKARGLAGTQLVISDAHTGLKAAIAAVLLGAAWQRCRVGRPAPCSRSHPGTHTESLLGQGAVAEGGDLGVQIGADPGHLGLGDAGVRAQGADQIVDLPHFSALRARPGAQGQRRDGRRRHPHRVRPAGCRARALSAGRHRGMLGRQFPQVEAMLRDAEDDLLAFTAFPVAHSEVDLVDQPAGTAEQGDQAPHRRRRRLPHPRRCSAWPARSSWRPTTNGRSLTAATSPKAPWPCSHGPASRGGGAAGTDRVIVTPPLTNTVRTTSTIQRDVTAAITAPHDHCGADAPSGRHVGATCGEMTQLPTTAPSRAIRGMRCDSRQRTRLFSCPGVKPLRLRVRRLTGPRRHRVARGASGCHRAVSGGRTVTGSVLRGHGHGWPAEGISRARARGTPWTGRQRRQEPPLLGSHGASCRCPRGDSLHTHTPAADCLLTPWAMSRGAVVLLTTAWVAVNLLVLAACPHHRGRLVTPGAPPCPRHRVRAPW
jgi:hypothetical protein